VSGTSLNRAPSGYKFAKGDIMSLDSGANYHGYIGTLAAHISLQFIYPVICKIFCSFTFKNDLTTFLPKCIAYRLYTISAPDTFAYFRYQVKRKCSPKHFFQ